MSNYGNDIQDLLGRLVSTVTSAGRAASVAEAAQAGANLLSGGSASAQGGSSSASALLTATTGAVSNATRTSAKVLAATTSLVSSAAVPSSTVSAGLLPLLSPWQSVAGVAASSGDGAAGWLTWLNPLLGGLLSLFGGGSTDQATTLTKFLLPESQNYQAGFGTQSGDAVVGIDYGQSGVARPPLAGTSSTLTPALDSTWFIDHTQEIAQAVKRALLESDSLPDVLRDF